MILSANTTRLAIPDHKRSQARSQTHTVWKAVVIDVIVVIGVKRSARLGKLHRTWLKVTGIPTRVVALVGVRRKSTLWPHRSSASMSGFHEQMRKDDTRRVLGWLPASRAL